MLGQLWSCCLQTHSFISVWSRMVQM
jgi:hypothetical protein